jgi:PAT family beta-lactamase induction signal transducer AmpG
MTYPLHLLHHPLFLLDKPEVGGLGLITSDVGLVYGTFGVFSLILGGILGGFVIAKYGLKKWLVPMALAMNLPNIFYVYMAYAQPPMALVYPLVSLEQFGYGFGFTAFSIYLMYISPEEYKTSHFAISTGFMALGMMLPGLVSGYIQKAVGYPLFFILVCLFTIPGMIALFFIPLNQEAHKS